MDRTVVSDVTPSSPVDVPQRSSEKSMESYKTTQQYIPENVRVLFILILSTHLCLGNPKNLFLYLNKIIYIKLIARCQMYIYLKPSAKVYQIGYPVELFKVSFGGFSKIWVRMYHGTVLPNENGYKSCLNVRHEHSYNMAHFTMNKCILTCNVINSPCHSSDG
jgi:hypothetical protein